MPALFTSRCRPPVCATAYATKSATLAASLVSVLWLRVLIVTAGMGDMAKMEMPLPDNTIPMMTGWGPHGPIEMGGMFSVVKVREGTSPSVCFLVLQHRQRDGGRALTLRGLPMPRVIWLPSFLTNGFAANNSDRSHHVAQHFADLSRDLLTLVIVNSCHRRLRIDRRNLNP